jgi:hypothetical protein
MCQESDPHSQWKLFITEPIPRRIPQEIAKSALKVEGARMTTAIGLLFVAVGMIAAWHFAPRKLVEQWRLHYGKTEVVEGTIDQTEKLGIEFDHNSVFEYHYSFTPKEAGLRQGIGYTTGPRWNRGDKIPIRYLSTNPTVSVPTGGRVDRSPIAFCFVHLFWVMGLGAIYAPMREMSLRKKILERGTLTTASVASVAQLTWSQEDRPRFRIDLIREGDQHPIVVKIEDPLEVELMKEKLTNGKSVACLHLSGKFNRVVFPEIWERAHSGSLLR